ncbi:MAG: trehalose-6-phosphate synthase [Deltaproteobacteria bacterium]|nr:trehalose-6-phosphate synthase [Deltaproteobacteria bacterium]
MVEELIHAKRMVIVSNRLPITLHKTDAGQWQIKSGSGGLITALGAVLRNRGGRWIGWIGADDESAIPLAKGASREAGYELTPVLLTAEEVDRYYHGFANAVLWPLFHDFINRCDFAPEYWPAYQQVNHKFARIIAETTAPTDYIWVQDYHLTLVAGYLRELGANRRTGFFLHVPFPPLDIFLRLPWRAQVLNALLQFDLIAFQTMRDHRNFMQCVRTLLPGIRLEKEDKFVSKVTTPERSLRVAAIPIGIDYDEFARGAEQAAEAAWYIHEKLPERQLILGVDRLDYSKGIPQRIRAIGNALERYPDLRERFTFTQVVVPSREDVPEYQELRSEIERLVGEINGRFTTSGWTPIHYIYRSLTREELLAYYRTSEVMLVTPLKDGMNLVAKEFCACSIEENAVLILSEFAGAAAQLSRYALLVNPYDVEGVADALHTALSMDGKERQSRMHRARTVIRRESIYWWVDNFLKAAISADLSYFPRAEYFVPQMDNKESA